MKNPFSTLREMTGPERAKAALLGTWFFLVITTLWLLKPIRNASLLAHLGSGETPYVRLGSVVVVALVVAAYSRVVDRLSRLQVAAGASLLFSAVLVAFWSALHVGGEVLGAQRWFVWAVFILVDIYSTVMVGIFWIYANDVVSRSEADRLYGPIGVGGIVGGIAGGAIVDSLVQTLGHVDILLLCAALGVACGGAAWLCERKLHPVARKVEAAAKGEEGASAALAGAREVLRSPYLLLIVGIVVGYEFAAAMTDFVVNVVFEANFESQDELAQMFGRVGWIVSSTALFSQLVLVPMLLPYKRVALILPPIAMAVATVGMAAAPVVWAAVLLSVADRGLNYSLQQVTKETLYVPLTDAQKYKAKAFIDMFVDRAGKALSALALMAIIEHQGISITSSLVVALGALLLWAISAFFLGRVYRKTVEAAAHATVGAGDSEAARPVRP